MTYFKHIVLRQIKSAKDDNEVQSVIELSMQRLKSRNINGHLIQRFIVAMDKTLDEAKREDPSERELRNVDTTIRFFRKLHRS